MSIPVPGTILSITIALNLLLSASSVLAQPTPQSEPKSAAVTMLVRLVLENPRVRSALGPGDVKVVAVEVAADKADAEAYLDGKREEPPARQATLLLWNRQSDKAVRAVASSNGDTLVSMEAVASSTMPLLPEELEEAFTLVKASPEARRAVGPSLNEYRLVLSGDDVAQGPIAQALPIRSSNAADPCAAGRCMDFIFSDVAGYLPLRIQVNLKLRAVRVLQSRSHEGAHS